MAMIVELRRRWLGMTPRERAHVTWLLGCVAASALAARLVDVALQGLQLFER